MVEKLGNFQYFHNFSKNIFLYSKPKKLEDNENNILKSFHCTTRLVRRVMEYSDVIMFEMLFRFCHSEQMNLHSRNHIWKVKTQKSHQIHQIFSEKRKCSITVYTFSLSYKLSDISSICYHYIIHLIPPDIYILYDECSEAGREK